MVAQQKKQKGAVNMEEKTLNYRQEGEYLVPDLTVEDSGRTYGRYGRLRKKHLQAYHKGTYSAMLLSGKLLDHLADVDEAAMDQMETICRDMMKQEGVTEALKARDMMEWVGRVNNIKARAEEMVLADLIYI